MNDFHPEEHHHEILYRQLQLLAIAKTDLDHKMHDWEVAYQGLREVENSLIQAYGSLRDEW